MPQVPRASPTRRTSNVPPPGFRVPPRPKPPPITSLDADELRSLRDKNNRILASPGASTSTYVQRVANEQTAIEARLADIEGLRSIDAGMRGITIGSGGAMDVDKPKTPALSRTQAAKRNALSKASIASRNESGGAFSFEDAMQLEREAYLRDKERQQRREEKQHRAAVPSLPQSLSKQEQEARILAFMNYTMTDSDLEDEDDDDDSDPGTWFDGQDEDGVKGQNIVLPDVEDFSDVIRLDESRIPYNIFYEPRDNDQC